MILFHVPRLYNLKYDMKVIMMDKKVVRTSFKLLSHYLCEVYEVNHQQSQDNFQCIKILTAYLSNTDYRPIYNNLLTNAQALYLHSCITLNH